MKIKVVNVKILLSPQGAALKLEGAKYYLLIHNIPPDVLSHLILAQKPVSDTRLSLVPMLKKVIPPDSFKEVFVFQKGDNQFAAEAIINDQKLVVLPSAGIFIALALDKPIYFDSALGKSDPVYQMLS